MGKRNKLSQERLRALQKIADRIGVDFSDSWRTLHRALTHKSYREVVGHAPDNEWLEWLGDAIFEAEATLLVATRFPNWTAVNREKAMRWLTTRAIQRVIAQRLGLQEFILVSENDIKAWNGGKKDTLLDLAGNALEAIVGAIASLKHGEAVVHAFCEWLLQPLISQLTAEKMSSLPTPTVRASDQLANPETVVAWVGRALLWREATLMLCRREHLLRAEAHQMRETLFTAPFQIRFAMQLLDREPHHGLSGIGIGSQVNVRMVWEAYWRLATTREQERDAALRKIVQPLLDPLLDEIRSKMLAPAPTKPPPLPPEQQEAWRTDPCSWLRTQLPGASLEYSVRSRAHGLNRIYEAQLYYNGSWLSCGNGDSEETARQAAAKSALHRIKKTG